MSTPSKSDPKVVRTVPRGYFEPGAEEYPEPVANKATGELTGHAWIEPVLPDTAKETNAEE